MEERQPQDFEVNLETTEPNAEVTNVADIETAEVEPEKAESAEVASAEVESDAENSEKIEDTKEDPTQAETEAPESEKTEPTEAELAEETAAEENIEEVSDALESVETSQDPDPALDAKPEATEPKVDKPVAATTQIGGTFAKWASTGLVIQSWQLALAVVVVLAMVVGGVVLGVVLGNRDDPKDSDFDDSPVDYEWVMPEGGYTDEDQIILPGYVDLTFPAGEQEIEVVLPNPKSNPCYFRYTLMLEATGEILYQSKLIPPGKAVLEIKLSRPLPKGDYSLLIGIDSVSLADGRTPMNGGEQKVLLKVR